jgi:shikimate dehydrogenase
VNDQTLLGLVGHPVLQSLSPVFHNAALRYCHKAGEYKLFDVAESELSDKVRSLVAQGLAGFNVTIPHKTAVCELVDQLAPEAKLIGAVNTVKVDGDQLIGYNTDAIGFRLAVVSQFGECFQDGSALLLGYGGSARAVLIALAQLGLAEVRVIGRDSAKLQVFIEQAQERVHTHAQLLGSASKMRILPYEANSGAEPDLIANTIPFGIGKSDPIPVWLKAITAKLPKTTRAVDLVYLKDQRLPPFAKSLADRGLIVQDGLEMLLQQARASFEIWTGEQVPIDIMRSALGDK